MSIHATPPNPADVLVNGQWTGPGTANPQAGEIAGADPGLTQLANYMGMTEAQTAAWIVQSQAAPRAAAAPIPAASLAGSVPWYGWAAGAVVLISLFSSGGRR